MARSLLVAAALAPAVVGNLMRLFASEPAVVGALLLLVGFAAAGAVALRRLVAAGELALAPSFAAHAGQWRVAAALVALLPVWLPGLRVPAGVAHIAADIVFWSAVLVGAAPRARRLAMLAAVVYAVARTSSLGALVTTNENVAETWALVHSIGAVIAAVLIAVAIWRAAPRPRA